MRRPEAAAATSSYVVWPEAGMSVPAITKGTWPREWVLVAMNVGWSGQTRIRCSPSVARWEAIGATIFASISSIAFTFSAASP